jgi:hypothetical protein
MSSTFPSIQESDLNSTPIVTRTIYVSNSVGLRVYSDTRPHNWKIADLQKGLILVCSEKETVGEGTGFGLPILAYSNETYFSTISKVYLSSWKNCCIIRKEFAMDRIARNRYRNVRLENKSTRALFAHLADLYQKHPRFRFLALKSVTGKMQIDTAFVKATSVGKVIVTYAISGPRILVKADFSCLRKIGLRGIFVLNEQGSRFFRRYVDSENTEVKDGKIGAWDGINAEWACLTDLEGRFGFRLWRMKDCVLRRGREYLQNSLDWIGLDYEINPGTTVFEYPIEILGA